MCVNKIKDICVKYRSGLICFKQDLYITVTKGQTCC